MFTEQVNQISGFTSGDSFRPCSLAARLKQAGGETLSAVVMLDKNGKLINVWHDDPDPVNALVRCVADNGMVVGLTKLFTKHMDYEPESPAVDIKLRFLANMANEYASRVSHLKEV